MLRLRPLLVVTRRMAGHSQFANRKHIKGANDLKRAQLFTKLGRDITTAVKMGGSSVETNARLRTAIENARKSDMPKAKIDAAISKGMGVTDDEVKDLLIEVTGPNALFLLIEVEAAQKEQVVPELRRELRKLGATIGKDGSASWAFDRVGQVTFGREQLKKSDGSEWDLEELALEVDANEVADAGEDAESDTAGFVKLLCDADKLKIVEENLAERNIDVAEAKAVYKPNKPAALKADQDAMLDSIIDRLSASDFVTRITDNRS